MTNAHRNLLFETFPESDRADLRATGREVELHAGQKLQGLRHSIAFVYFPTSACMSLHARNPEGGPEVMMVGFEGALGVQLALDAAAQPLAAIVQSPGSALRIDAGDFCRQLDRPGPLRHMLHCYVDVMMQDAAISCGCLHAHPVSQRLARRLLMSHDRARQHDFSVTHDFLAMVMGVRRAGVSAAATQLQHDGIIAYSRGRVSVLDRKRLQAASCTCYTTSRRVYAHGLRSVARAAAI